jgi:F0F1-type ATP synthase delta subunit
MPGKELSPNDLRHQAQQQLNELLKKSDYLNSIIDSQRVAASQAIALIMKALIKHDPSLGKVMLDAVVEIESKTHKSPSVDGDRSLIARAIRAELQR